MSKRSLNQPRLRGKQAKFGILEKNLYENGPFLVETSRYQVEEIKVFPVGRARSG
jgi:hypothetical protein